MQFAVRINRRDWNAAHQRSQPSADEQGHPGQLAPGSTFKIIMSVAGLAGGRRAGYADQLHRRMGAIRLLPPLRRAPWRGGYSQRHSIPATPSTYMLGDKLGIDRIAKYATAFGYGQKTGIDLPGEHGGPDALAQWKLKNYHQR
jgi:penicillin-binding protein 2